jgi:UDPglucose 6-dehydrogenase
MHVTTAASEANLAAQDRFAARVSSAVGGARGRTIGMLGLAFKAGTDDIRDSPAIRLADRLIEGGATIRAYDPAAGANAAARLPALDVVDDPSRAIDGVDAIVIATEWPEFRDLPWAAWIGRPNRPLVIDGRRLLDADALRAAGYTVFQLGDGRVQPDRPTPALARSDR